MPINQILKISDNDGFTALVNTARYQSFVDEDWELDQLLKHFASQMNAGSFLIWQTTIDGGTWNVHFTNQQSDKESFREFEGNIEVTDGKLFLTEYTDLTMAAQFPDESIPSRHNSNLFIELENGPYQVKIRQFFDLDTWDTDTDSRMHFEIVFKKLDQAEVLQNNFEKVPWSNLS